MYRNLSCLPPVPVATDFLVVVVDCEICCFPALNAEVRPQDWYVPIVEWSRWHVAAAAAAAEDVVKKLWVAGAGAVAVVAAAVAVAVAAVDTTTVVVAVVRQ